MDTKIKHLLKRTTFGFNPSLYSGKTLEQVVDSLFTVNDYGLPLKSYRNEDYPAGPNDPDISLPIGQTWVGVQTDSGSVKVGRRNSLKNWWLKNLIVHGSLEEKMLFFWHNHFGVTLENFLEPNLGYQYFSFLKSNTFGDFKSFVRNMSIEPAMLYFLNGETNNAGNTNKNYARELFELFTLGRGNYTEEDIVESSRALTGWWFHYWTGESTNEPKRHDFGLKTFSSHFKNTSFGGNGIEDLDSLINMIFVTQSQTVARFIATKLYIYFVNYDVTETALRDCINPVADSLIKNNWNIKAALKTLFLTPHFYLDEFVGCQIKSPLELSVGVLREFNIKLPNMFDPKPSAYEEEKFYAPYFKRTEDMGISLGVPPDVSGWKAYYHAPSFDKLWYNTDSAINRQKFLDDMFDPWSMTWMVPYMNNIDVLRFATTILVNPSDPNAVVKDSVDMLFPVMLPDATLLKIKTDILLSGQAEDRYWTNAWNKFMQNPNDDVAKSIVFERLLALYKFLLSQEEYQIK